MSSIMVRQATSEFRSWQIADVATRAGCRVVSIALDQRESWHIFVELPDSREPGEIDDMIAGAVRLLP